jgi:hypothetical protein
LTWTANNCIGVDRKLKTVIYHSIALDTLTSNGKKTMIVEFGGIVDR